MALYTIDQIRKTLGSDRPQFLDMCINAEEYYLGQDNNEDIDTPKNSLTALID